MYCLTIILFNDMGDGGEWLTGDWGTEEEIETENDQPENK